ncbi:Anoctamin [Caenorhabditis elegans]|nr:Anoctamin [Caenorhabditis elegans]CAD56259.3 Anoctamin [Caenorhabditis elegans]|eukprot:NP_001255821.1 Anoctamin [Caenorhabditis elegans]
MATLHNKFGAIIQDGIVEGQRFALSSDLWRYASTSTHCDLLITMQFSNDDVENKTSVMWLVQQMREHEPNLRIEVRYHRLNSCYAIYLTADYKTLLKGAELCHIKKAIKSKFGGGMRDFSFEEAQFFSGVEGKNTFLSPMERTIIVKQMMDMMRAGKGGLSLKLPRRTITFTEGTAIVPRLISMNVVQNVSALHNTEFLKHLQQKWVFSIDEQPIDQVKDYFGTEIAMYFAWLGHMTTALWFPSLLGILMWFLGGFKYKNSPGDKQDLYQLISDICFVLFAFFNCIWSTIYLEWWKRVQAELAFKWGTYDATQDSYLQDPRPAFQGDYLAPNPVSGRLEPFYPAWKHTVMRYVITYPITFLCVVGMFAAMLAIFTVQDLADFYFGDSWMLSWLCYFPMIFYALMIVISDKIYRRLALILNDLENYRTDDEYEDFLITKIVLFQFVTAFGSLFYIAFVLRDMKRLQETLATLLITRQVTQNIMETVVPFMIEKLKLSSLTYKMTRSMSDGTLRRHVENVRNKRQNSVEQEEEEKSPRTPTTSFFTLGSPTTPETEVRQRKPNSDGTLATGDFKQLRTLSSIFREDFSLKTERLPLPEFKPCTDSNPELTQAELESVMSVYARPLDDFLEMFIQFGYVLLFSPAFPLAAVCALINNLIEIRVDAFKLCNTVQRPFGRRVKDIGAWQKAMEILGILGVIVNCALIGQSGLVQRIWPDLSWGGQILIIVVLEHVILASKMIIDILVPDVPHWVRIETAKQEHFRREAFKRESRLLSFTQTPPTDQIGQQSQNEPISPSESTSRFNRLDQINRSKRRSITPMVRLSSFTRKPRKEAQDNCID